MLCADLHGKEIKKDEMYVYVQLTHLAIHTVEANTDCKATIHQ